MGLLEKPARTAGTRDSPHAGRLWGAKETEPAPLRRPWPNAQAPQPTRGLSGAPALLSYYGVLLWGWGAAAGQVRSQRPTVTTWRWQETENKDGRERVSTGGPAGPAQPAPRPGAERRARCGAAPRSCPVLSSYTPRCRPAHGRPPCSSPPAERVGAGRARAYLVVLTGRVQATAGWVAFLGWVRSESGERGGARRSLPAALRGVLACSYRHK